MITEEGRREEKRREETRIECSTDKCYVTYLQQLGIRFSPLLALESSARPQPAPVEIDTYVT